MAKYRRKKLGLAEKGYLVAATRRSTPSHLGAGAGCSPSASSQRGTWRRQAGHGRGRGRYGRGGGEAWWGASDAAQMWKKGWGRAWAGREQGRGGAGFTWVQEHGGSALLVLPCSHGGDVARQVLGPLAPVIFEHKDEGQPRYVAILWLALSGLPRACQASNRANPRRYLTWYAHLNTLSRWIVYPGGRAMLDSVELSPGKLTANRRVVAEYGNIVRALARICARRAPALQD
ncbi:unnamed protein product [Miscanthus lutarioriparius]|uniref:Uncharacterized protein n=1 Tax=Miscanthus lutarioriparius TaxID=422564 RepID=A0A811RG97_9POAL|nr:unnamed protein product [Miscanthus lutarioriparius]